MKRNMRKFWTILGLLALIWTCGGGPEEEILKTYPNGQKQEVARYEWKGGERHMVSKDGYHSNGAGSFKETYQKGSMTSYRSWWPNGQPRVVRTYEGGAPVREVSYDTDGIRCLTGEEINLIRRRLADYPGEPASPQDTVVMETSAGTIRLRLFTDIAPGHSDNFKRLANFGFYDSTTFHRVVPGFVIQGGDILSRDAQRSNDGQGGPGYTIPAEFNPRPHRKGSLAMARSRDPNSAGSQFYIALRRLPQLDNQYTVFGEVIDGIAIVDSIAAAATDSRDNPVQPQRILRVAIHPGPTPSSTPGLPPSLTAAIVFTESSGDNILAAAEEGNIEVTLRNRGKGEAKEVEVLLEGQAYGISFPTQLNVGEVPPGGLRKVSLPLKAALNVADGKVSLTIRFREANGFEPDPIEITFETLAFVPPMLAVADVGVDDASGNGMIEPGEVVSVVVRVQNHSQGTAEVVGAKINLGKNVFLAEGSRAVFQLGTLGPGAHHDLEFQLYTNRRAVDIPVTVTITERHGKFGATDIPLELPFNQPVRSIQQVVIAGKKLEMPEIGDVGGLSIDIEQNIPRGRDLRNDAVALIIANRHYQHRDVPEVTFAHRDGEFVKQYLIQTLGYREGNVFFYRDATKTNFLTALQKLKNAAREGNDMFIYYTGHGAPDPEEHRGYFVPVDADPNYVTIGGVALDEFYNELRDVPARQLVVVIDACFSGISHEGMIIRNISPIFLEVESQARLGANTVTFTSSSGEEVSSWFPDQKHSLYTYYFLKGLQGEADSNENKLLTVGELHTYLKEQVPYTARRLYGRQQTPGVTPDQEQRVLVRYK